MPRDRRGDAGPGHVAVANPTRSNDGKLSVPGSRPGSMGRVEAALRNPTPPVSTSHRAGEVRGLPTGCDVDPAEPFRPSFAPEPRIPAMISGSARQRREFAVYASVRRSRGLARPGASGAGGQGAGAGLGPAFCHPCGTRHPRRQSQIPAMRRPGRPMRIAGASALAVSRQVRRSICPRRAPRHHPGRAPRRRRTSRPGCPPHHPRAGS